jgi:hypothetical protein
MKRYIDGADQKIASSMKESINKILYDTFLAQFSQFKSSPQSFFDALADDITVSLFDTETLLGDIGIDKLREAFNRFLELGISRLAWIAGDGIKTWQSAKNIADRLSKMADANIFDSDELYELHDTLLERYCFFLNAVKTIAPSSLFSELKNTINSQTTQLLDDDELELCLETRRQRFTQFLCECEFKSHAQSQGFMVG